MKLTLQQLEAHLWGAANILRGKTAGQDYKNYILSLMFYKRLCDQWEWEADDSIAELERQQGREFTEAEKALFRNRGEHRYAIPDGSRWGDIKAVSVNIGEILTGAMRAVADANDELRGVFTVDWNQPAPDGSGRPLIANEVVHALVQHFDEHDLSNRSVPADVLGRAYEYLIKKFADDAGAKAGEFFTPPEVVDTLVRILEPSLGDTIYDPTGGSGGMLVHAAEYLREQGHLATHARYFAQEMNWNNAAIGKINSVLHGLEADIRAGHSTITDPQFLQDGKVLRFSLVLANFPFSDDYWWLRQGAADRRQDQEGSAEEGSIRQGGIQGHSTVVSAAVPDSKRRQPSTGTTRSSSTSSLRSPLTVGPASSARRVCSFAASRESRKRQAISTLEGNPKVRRRKADDEHLIRRALLESQLIDAVISLPLNVFYGAGVPACLLILRKQRPVKRRDRILMIYAARHYRELAAQNELRPQDVMRMLVHYHAYGDASKAPGLVAEHSERIRREIDRLEAEEVARLEAEYQPQADKLTALNTALQEACAVQRAARTKLGRAKAASTVKKLRKQRDKVEEKVTERDERIAKVRRSAQDDRVDVSVVGEELIALYSEPDELLRHARVVEIDEVEENEFNLNVPRYVDTFEPAPRMDLTDALKGAPNCQQRMPPAPKRNLSVIS